MISSFTFNLRQYLKEFYFFNCVFGNSYSLFIYIFFSIELSQYHVSSHGLNRFTKFGSTIFLLLFNSFGSQVNDHNLGFFLKKMHCLDIFSMIKKMIGPQYRVSHLSNNDRLLSSTHRFWQLHLVLLVLSFLIFCFHWFFFYNFILLHFCYRRLIIIIVFSSLSMVSSRWFFFPL